MTDEQLVAEAKKGDVKAQEELLLRYKKVVLSIARRFFFSGIETEDLVQEGMCGLYAAIGSYDQDKSHFRAYAYSCIHNRIIDLVKSAQSNKNKALTDSVPILEIEEDYLFDPSPSPEDVLVRRENRREFLHKMGTILSPMEFQIVVMYMDGLSVGEIAATLNKPPKTIENALYRSKHKIQTLFKE